MHERRRIWLQRGWTHITQKLDVTLTGWRLSAFYSFFQEHFASALVWFLETGLNNKCYFDQLLSGRRTSPAWLRSGRKRGASGGTDAHISVTPRLSLGVCCHSPSFHPSQTAAPSPAGPLLSGDISIAGPSACVLLVRCFFLSFIYLFIYLFIFIFFSGEK